MRKFPIHLQILSGLGLGLLFGLATIFFGIPVAITTDFIKPVGTIFVNGLQMIAVPLVFASLIVGISNLGDLTKLSRIGGKTIMIYIITTTIAITTGLIAVNLLQPGKQLQEDTRQELFDSYSQNADSSEGMAGQLEDRGPLEPLVDMVPSNVVNAFSDNGNMLQVVFFAILIGIALIKIPTEKSQYFKGFFDALNEIIIKIVGFIMLLAPYAVFALIASLIVELAGDNPGKALELLYALFWYSATVILGLLVMVLLIYPGMFKIFTKVKYGDFFRGIRPAQLLAFSTSSSSATLPVTMERVEKELGVSEEVSSFVLPLGATINMDGTSLYQGVAAVFIAQAMGLDLSLGSQLTIVLTATLASIGTAGVPGAGIIMLVIVLESVGVPTEGIALIMAPDRILDMCRTTVNVTGDASVSIVVASTEGELPEGVVRKNILNVSP